jgi:hypothetical protein
VVRSVRLARHHTMSRTADAAERSSRIECKSKRWAGARQSKEGIPASEETSLRPGPTEAAAWRVAERLQTRTRDTEAR